MDIETIRMRAAHHRAVASLTFVGIVVVGLRRARNGARLRRRPRSCPFADDRTRAQESQHERFHQRLLESSTSRVHHARSSIAGCALLLWVAAARKTGRRATATTPPATSGTRTCARLNNPLPRWWMWLFYITIVFGLVYLVLYPGLGSYRGQARLEHRAAQYDAEVQQADTELEPLYAQVRRAGRPKTLAADPQRAWRSASACS